LEKNHGFFLVAATLATTKTYTAGLSPLGGRSYWYDNKGSHIAGDLVLRDKYP
uniref:PGG domain-containing protein n=1 Tax=Aegilops tauschii subsp. strangulata TaxID=200361 RepID=A0A453RDC0_AEGTS